METKLNAQSQDEYDKYVADQVQLIHTIFISKTARFDGKLTEEIFFDEMIICSNAIGSIVFIVSNSVSSQVSPD